MNQLLEKMTDLWSIGENYTNVLVYWDDEPYQPYESRYIFKQWDDTASRFFNGEQANKRILSRDRRYNPVIHFGADPGPVSRREERVTRAERIRLAQKETESDLELFDL